MPPHLPATYLWAMMVTLICVLPLNFYFFSPLPNLSCLASTPTTPAPLANFLRYKGNSPVLKRRPAADWVQRVLTPFTYVQRAMVMGIPLWFLCVGACSWPALFFLPQHLSPTVFMRLGSRQKYMGPGSISEKYLYHKYMPMAGPVSKTKQA